MSSYLLTWNPKRFDWRSFAADVDAARVGQTLEFHWSCGNTRRIREGDDVFLVRQGPVNPGLIGHGWVTDPPFEGEHWPDDTSDARTAWYVGARWDFLADSPVVGRDRFRTPPFDTVAWGSQASGPSIPREAAIALQQAIDDRLNVGSGVLPDEIDESLFPEGGARRVVVNAYERNHSARAACLAHYGNECSVCNMSFEHRYGRLAAGFIHVHHITPVSSLPRRYKIDAIQDLRPVCPNCHAFLHLQDPPLSIEAARAAIIDL